MLPQSQKWYAGQKFQRLLVEDEDMVIVDLATVSANGLVTVPAPVRRKLHLAPGDKVAFLDSPDGSITLAKWDLAALANAQAAFAGAAADFGVKSEEDVQRLVDELRGGQ